MALLGQKEERPLATHRRLGDDDDDEDCAVGAAGAVRVCRPCRCLGGHVHAGSDAYAISTMTYVRQWGDQWSFCGREVQAAWLPLLVCCRVTASLRAAVCSAAPLFLHSAPSSRQSSLKRTPKRIVEVLV